VQLPNSQTSREETSQEQSWIVYRTDLFNRHRHSLLLYPNNRHSTNYCTVSHCPRLFCRLSNQSVPFIHSVLLSPRSTSPLTQPRWFYCSSVHLSFVVSLVCPLCVSAGWLCCKVVVLGCYPYVECVCVVVICVCCWFDSFPVVVSFVLCM